MKFDDYLREEMKNLEFKKEYDKLSIGFMIIDARRSAGLTQMQLSLKTGIAQTDISRIENGISSPSIKTLLKIATGLNMKLKVELVPLDE